MRDYGSLEEVAVRLRRTNPRLTPERAEFLAPHWAQLDTEGRWRVAGDPAHRIVNPVLYRLEEVLACWRRVSCPVLWVQAAHTEVMKFVDQDPTAALAEIERRMRSVPDVRSAVVEDAGHMLHHDQPAIVAGLIANFVDQGKTAPGAQGAIGSSR
jgi:pimeloyl-ACP methyl ester carboxylesterase